MLKLKKFKKNEKKVKKLWFLGSKNEIIFLLYILQASTISWYSSYLIKNSYLGLSPFYISVFIDFLLFLIIPLIILKFNRTYSLKDYGFNFSGFSLGLKTILFSFPFIFIISWIVSKDYNSSRVLEFSYNSKELLIYFLIQAVYLFCWEFFCRGYILNEFKKITEYYLFIHLFPYVFLHYGKGFLETYSSIFGGIFLGILTIRTGSFVYGFLIHYFLISVLDLFILLRFYSGEYGISFESFLKLFN